MSHCCNLPKLFETRCLQYPFVTYQNYAFHAYYAYQKHALLVYAMQWDQLELFWTVCLQDSTVTDQTLSLSNIDKMLSTSQSSKL